MSHICIMLVYTSVTASVFTQQLLMSPWPFQAFDSVAMLPSSLTSSLEPIGGGFQPAEGCDLQSSLESLQAVCDSLIGLVNRNTHAYYCTVMQQHPACSLHTELWVILHLRGEKEWNIPLRLWIWVLLRFPHHIVAILCHFQSEFTQ